MTVYSIYIFNKKCEAIYFKSWNSPSSLNVSDSSSGQEVDGDSENHKLVYGVVFSLKNMVSKMSAGKPAQEGFISYKTSTYKLHYFESPAGVKMVMITDRNAESMLDTLRSIYAKLYVEYVVKNPLAKPNTPIKNELFRSNLDKFILALPNFE
ncbi:Sybindin-like protein [Obelidium mucronatum]|nr:Sybindin-like protein [Obelidium mucronatum]